MVVGNGLIAKAFYEFTDVDSVVIFGSGVSNSSEKNQTAFLREENLIKEFLAHDKLFVYFSTCSVYDEGLSDSLYIQHKLRIEKFIQNNFANYLIVRLPNVVGACSNPYTLMNYFYNQISTENEILVQKNASRYLVHIDEVKNIVSSVIRSEVKLNLIADLVIHKRMTILEIIEALERFIRKKAIVRVINSGYNYEVQSHPVFKKYISTAELSNEKALNNLITLTYEEKY